MNKILNEADFKKSFKERDGTPFWWAVVKTDSSEDVEVVVSEDGPCASPADIVVANEILSDLETIKTAAECWMKGHLITSDKYFLGFLEILAKPDRHGATALLIFHLDQETYLWLEIGLRDRKPIYLLAKYY